MFPEFQKISEEDSSPTMKFTGKSEKYNWERMFNKMDNLQNIRLENVNISKINATF